MRRQLEYSHFFEPLRFEILRGLDGQGHERFFDALAGIGSRGKNISMSVVERW
jgi:hypothetical protein